MRYLQIALSSSVVILAQAKALAADGSAAPYNEAVQIVAGKRVVDVAPFPDHMKLAVSTFKQPTAGGDLVAIETPAGLMDCSGTLWFHLKACSASTFGREKRMRTWVVKMSGKWFACGSYTSAKTCVPIIVDGKLRPIPATKE